MKIGAQYSHLNGYEWLVHHHQQMWNEVVASIKAVDAKKCRTKISKEKTMLGKLLYSPTCLNAAFKEEFLNRGWELPDQHNFYASADQAVTKKLVAIDTAIKESASDKDKKKALGEQAELLKEKGLELIKSHNRPDFYKERVSLEVQFGKYSFVQFDIFIKHAANYMHDRINLGIEIVPMKVLEKEMSSGPPYYEKHLHEIIRQGRIFPPVPLILIGVEP